MAWTKILYKRIPSTPLVNLILRIRFRRCSLNTNGRGLASASSSFSRFFSSTNINEIVFGDGKNRQILKSKKHVSAVDSGKGMREEMKRIFTATELLEVYKKYSGDLPGSEYVRMLVRLAKFKNGGRLRRSNRKDNQALGMLLEDIKANTWQMKPFEFADVIWCLGKIEVTDVSPLNHFGSILETMDVTQFSNTDMSMILWGHGKLGIAAPVLFSQIKKEVLYRGVEHFQTRELCQIVWSFARTLKGSAKLFAAVREEIQRRDISKFNKQDLLMLLWAYSEAGVNVKPLFRYFKIEILRSKRLSECGTRDLSQIVWAFANQSIKAPELFSLVERELLMRPVVHFDDQSFVVVAWSFAQTDNSTPRLFQFLESKLMATDLNGWSLHRLSRLMWAFTKTGQLTKSLLQKLSTAILSHNFAEFTQNALEEVVCAMQDCTYRVSPKLVAAVEAELMKRANEKY